MAAAPETTKSAAQVESGDAATDKATTSMDVQSFFNEASSQMGSFFNTVTEKKVDTQSVAEKAETVEKASSAEKAETVEKAEIVENTQIAQKAETVENTQIAQKAETSGNALGSAKNESADGREELKLLLEKPPGDAAAWLMSQVKELEKSNDVESTAIFRVAGAMKDSPTEKKEAVMSKMMQGAAELPLRQRAEFLLMVTTLPDPGKLKGDASPDDKAVKLARVAQEAGLADLPPEETEKLSTVMKKEQGAVVPAMLEAVPELDDDQRKRLVTSLVEKGAVKEEQAVVLEETLKPGGHMDSLKLILLWMDRVYKYTWTTLVVPACEVVIIIIFSITGCGASIFTFFIIDMIVGACIAASAFSVKYCLKYPYMEFCDNPLKMAMRVKQETAGGAKLFDVVPGSRSAMWLLMAIVFLVLLAAGIATTFGIMALLATFMSDCGGFSLFLGVTGGLATVGFRVITVIGLAYFAYTNYQSVQEFKKGLNSQSQPLIQAADKHEEGYGGVEGRQPPV